MKERLIYIDACKGTGMLLIMCIHIGVPVMIPMLVSVKVALFFLLSGLFFVENNDFGGLLKKNIRILLLPFVFFYLFSYILFYLGKFYVSGFESMTNASGIADCIFQKQYFNGPLWFIICLFWIKIICNFILVYVPKKSYGLMISLSIGLFGFSLSYYNIDLPLAIDTALTFTPIFYGGGWVKKNVIDQDFSKIESLLFSVFLYFFSFPFFIKVSASLNRYDGSFPVFIIFCFLLSLSILFFSKGVLSRSVVLSFIGRNSMWFMCTHHLFYRPIRLVLDKYLDSNESLIITLIVTLIVCGVTAPFVNKYCPVLVGKPNKIKLHSK